MTLDKALAILETYRKGDCILSPESFRNAVLLGHEALKRIAAWRQDPRHTAARTLPGESIDPPKKEGAQT